MPPSVSGSGSWLVGSAGSVAPQGTEDGRFIAVVRFESEEDARRNRDRPEQDRWWSETAKPLRRRAHIS